MLINILVIGNVLSVLDKAWLVYLYGENQRAVASELSTVQADTIPSVELACNGKSRVYWDRDTIL